MTDPVVEGKTLLEGTEPLVGSIMRVWHDGRAYVVVQIQMGQSDDTLTRRVYVGPEGGYPLDPRPTTLKLDLALRRTPDYYYETDEDLARRLVTEYVGWKPRQGRNDYE